MVDNPYVAPQEQTVTFEKRLAPLPAAAPLGVRPS